MSVPGSDAGQRDDRPRDSSRGAAIGHRPGLAGVTAGLACGAFGSYPRAALHSSASVARHAGKASMRAYQSPRCGHSGNGNPAARK